MVKAAFPSAFIVFPPAFPEPPVAADKSQLAAPAPVISCQSVLVAETEAAVIVLAVPLVFDWIITRPVVALPPVRVKPAVTVILPLIVKALVTTELFVHEAVKAAKVSVPAVSAIVKTFPPVIATLTVPHDFPAKFAVVSTVPVMFMVCVVLVTVGAFAPVAVNETFLALIVEELRVRVLAVLVIPTFCEPKFS